MSTHNKGPHFLDFFIKKKEEKSYRTREYYYLSQID